MKVTYNQLQKELLDKKESEKNLKKRTSTLRAELLESRDAQKRLILQYERIIKEWRNKYLDLIGNGWKIVFVKIKLWYDKKRGIKTIL